MNSFYVITNTGKDKNLESTRQVYDYLKSRGCECVVREFQKMEGLEDHGEGRYTDAEWIPHGTDAILVLGGDGTLIQAARDTIGRNIPLLGINLGTLGYLAEIEKSGITTALDALILDNYMIEPRMVLSGRVYSRDGKLISKNIAFNDIVVNRSGPLRVIELDIGVNGEPLNRYGADGIIICTPTGSTGYSMSAGGPIISPVASMIVVTPICPHTLTARSIVFSGSDRVRVDLCGGRRKTTETAVVSFDGEVVVPIETGDYVEIRKSRKTVNLLRINRVSFLEVLRNKMKGN